jgi:hypothetical protein
MPSYFQQKKTMMVGFDRKRCPDENKNRVEDSKRAWVERGSNCR